MSNTRWVQQITFAVWLPAFVASFARRVLGPVGADGFLREMKRAAGFMVRQFLAGVVAMQARSFAVWLPKADCLWIAGQVSIAITSALITLAFGLIARALMQGVA